MNSNMIGLINMREDHPLQDYRDRAKGIIQCGLGKP